MKKRSIVVFLTFALSTKIGSIKGGSGGGGEGGEEEDPEFMPWPTDPKDPKTSFRVLG